MPYSQFAGLFDQPAPTTTPYPQGIGFGLGQAAGGFTRNLIANMLWRQEEERRKRREALEAISAIARVGGGRALRGMPPDFFARAGLPPMSSFPRGLEEMKAEGMEQLWPSLSESERLGVISPEVFKAREHAKQVAEMRRRLTEPQPGAEGPAVEPQVQPSGGEGWTSPPGAAPARQRLRRSLKEGPGTIELTTTEELSTPDETKRHQLLGDRGRIENWLNQNVKAGKVDIHKEAADLGVKPSDVYQAILTDELRKLGHNIPSDVRGYGQLRDEAQRRKAEERKQTTADETAQVGQERLDLAQKQAVETAKRTELMFKQFNALLEKGHEERAMVRYQELRRALEAEMQNARKQLDDTVKLMQANPAYMADPSKAFADPNYKFWSKRLTDLEAEIRDLATRVESTPGTGRKTLVPRKPGGTAKEKFGGWVK